MTQQQIVDFEGAEELILDVTFGNGSTAQHRITGFNVIGNAVTFVEEGIPKGLSLNFVSTWALTPYKKPNG